MGITITSPLCGRNVTLNERQIIGLLTSNREEATRLGCWESIKNFFVKLLNHLPCVSLFDKKKFLDELYNFIHEGINVSVDAPSIKEIGVSVKIFWLLFEKLLAMLPYSEKDNICLRIDTALLSSNSKDPSLQIMVKGNPFPVIEFPRGDVLNLCLVSLHFLQVVEVGSDCYTLKAESLDPTSSTIVFSPPCRDTLDCYQRPITE